MSDQSPFRILAREHAADMLSRDDYIKIRSQMLVTLENKGKVNHQDMDNFLRLHHNNDDMSDSAKQGYSGSDWLIIALGMVAAIVLAYILYF